VVMRYSPEPPLHWLMQLASAVVKDEKLPQFQGVATSKLKKALIVEAALEKADQYGIPIGNDLLNRFEGWL